MLFAWLKTRRRRRLLQAAPPPGWSGHLDGVAQFHLVPEALRPRLSDSARIFVAEKTFEGCQGFEATGEVQATIAVLASVLTLGLDDNQYDNVHTILVYPNAFLVPKQTPIAGDVALVDQADHLGEAHYRGPVILSWEEVQKDASEPGNGFNLVYHEFAHQIDMLNGDADGVPTLPRELRDRWQAVMAQEYKRLCRAADRGRETLIDPYGASEPAEFFAVVTEAFFDMPRDLQHQHPDLYAIFREFYRVDPATWNWVSGSSR